MENPVICSLPFTTIYNAVGLNYAPCCWAKGFISDKNPKNTLPLDHFDGDDFRRLRKEMLIGEKTDFLERYCKRCWEREEDLKTSPRLSNLNEISEEQINKNFDANGKLIGDDRILSIKINFYGNYCNLECYYCHPANSTSRKVALDKLENRWQSNDIFNDKYTYDDTDVEKIDRNQSNNIINHITENAHRISTIEVCGGEPMLMKTHFKLLDSIISAGESSNINLSYISNMTAMEVTPMMKYFDAFKSILIQWSVDAIGERNRWIRYPTDWESTSKNAKEVQRYLNTNKKGIVQATMTPSILSIVTLKETYDWLFFNDFISFNAPILNYIDKPKFLRSRHLPDELKSKISKDVRSVSEFHYNELMSPRDENLFTLAVQYFENLDQSRGTNWRLVFPEIAEYAP